MPFIHKYNVYNNTIAYLLDVDFLDNEDLFNYYYKISSTARQKKTDNYKFQSDKKLSLGVEILLMEACNDFNVDYNKQCLIYGDNLKPYFKNSNIYFNLSHSGSKAMCVMSDFEVGCDIEKISSCNSIIADKFFTHEENLFLNKFSTESDGSKAFYRLWTLKESFLKCIGCGVSFPLDSFSILFNEDNSITVNQSISEYNFFFYEVECTLEYAMSICLRERI